MNKLRVFILTTQTIPLFVKQKALVGFNPEPLGERKISTKSHKGDLIFTAIYKD